MIKKKLNRFLFVVAAIFTGFLLPVLTVSAANDYPATHIAITPGRDISEINLSWYTPENSLPDEFQIALKSDMDGGKFSVKKARSYTGTVHPAAAGYTANKVNVTNLSESTEYVYRLGDGKNWSPTYNFTTRNSKEFGFIFVGDPQIGYTDSKAEGATWENTLAKAYGRFPDASFLMSAGDQVQRNKISLFGIFFSPSQLRSLPIAPVQGNHDTGYLKYFSYHFNLPNQSHYGKTSNGGEDGDYYYTYGNALFMFLNTNNQNIMEHTELMREAAEANPDVKWKVLMFHHSIYSTASHSEKPYVETFRNGLLPTIDDLKIDLVLMGHDHVYVRTHPMKNNHPQLDQKIDTTGNIINPPGTFYLTGNSSTGSKYYDIVSDPDFAAVNSQLKVPSFSYVRIGKNSLSLATYRTDTMEVVDAFTIIK